MRCAPLATTRPAGDDVAMGTADAAPLHSPDRWSSRVLPLRLVLPVLVVAAVAWLIATAVGQPLPLAAALGAGVLVICLLPVPRTSLAMALGARVRGSELVADPAQPPFDVPLPEGGSYGMRWNGSRIVTMLLLDARPNSVTKLSPAGLIGSDMLPLPELARCLDQFDITLAGIDIVSTGARSAGHGAVARIYENILGPLPAVAHRTLWLVLQLDPLHNAGAVQRRGGGPTGALRCAVVATRRVANRLAVYGLSASVLSAAQMNAVTHQLTLGTDPESFTESTRGLRHDDVHHVSYLMTPRALSPSGIAALWSQQTLATTITVRLRRANVVVPPSKQSDDTPVDVSAFVRFTTRHHPLKVSGRDLIALPGKQLRALRQGLPAGPETPAWPARYRGTADSLREIPLQITGCGQLIGADPSGFGVALPLVGRHVRRVEIIGSPLVAKQVILRAIALGASVVVHTDRHDEWRPMVAHLGMPHALSLATWSAASQQANANRSTDLVVYDGVEPTTHPSDATMLVLRPAASDENTAEPDVTLVEDPRRTNLVTVRTPAGPTPVYMVATSSELAYLGAVAPVLA